MSVLINVNSNDLYNVLKSNPIQIKIYDEMEYQPQYQQKIIQQLCMLYPDHRELINKVFKKNINYSNMSRDPRTKKFTACDVYIY
jgi:hypothetical protein